MTTKSMAYDHATYIARMGISLGEAGGAATTQYNKYAAFTTMLAFSAQLTVTAAGTAAGHGFSLIRITTAGTGLSTSTYATTTLGTSAIGYTTNLLLSTATGGVSLNQGDIIAALSLSDATGKAAIAYEVNATPLANVTA